MMNRDKWTSKIVDVARDIASRDFQERSWFGIGPEVSSPNELYNTLFDDCTLDLFLETYGASLTAQQRIACANLKSQLEQYDEHRHRLDDPRQVLNDPEWQEVRQVAVRFVEAFSNPDSAIKRVAERRKTNNK
jgi:hypothetical protein